MSPNQVNFLPPGYQGRHYLHRIWVVRGGLAVVMLAVMVASTIVMERRRSNLSVSLQEISARYENARSRIAQVELLDRRKADLSSRLAVLQDVLVRARGSLVLEAVGESCPGSTSFTKLDVRLRDSGTEPSVGVTLEGQCPDDLDVANLLTALSTRPLFSDVRMVLSEDVDATFQSKKFVITAVSPARLTEDLLEDVR